MIKALYKSYFGFQDNFFEQIKIKLGLSKTNRIPRQNSVKFGQVFWLKTGVGNYFRPWATLGFYLCLAGQIQVKYAFSKLKREPMWAGCGPRAVFMLPPPSQNRNV